MKLSMFKCQTRLMAVWVTGCFILLIIIWFQNMFGHYRENGQEAVEWLLPAITPTLFLVTGVWLDSAREKEKKDVKKIDKNIYKWVMSVSILYLLFILIIFAIQPMVAKPPLEVLRDSSSVLAIFQGLTCGYIGVFFTKYSK